CMQKSFEDHLKLALAAQASQEPKSEDKSKTTRTGKTKVKPKSKTTAESKTVKSNGVRKPLN
ncbi:MAG: hypothetical protein KJO34_15530, partial [Deltaproteobacteria bacterium]|nr:hypothetical protein [Deltaproteobacteria bacterium]